MSIFPPPLPGKEKEHFTFKKESINNNTFSNEKRLELSESVPEKEKIVYVK